MIDFILYYPAAACTVAALLLVGLFYFVTCGARCTIITLCILCLAPLWPFLLLRWLCVTVVDVIDWIVNKPWAKPFVFAARNIANRLQPQENHHD